MEEEQEVSSMGTLSLCQTCLDLVQGQVAAICMFPRFPHTQSLVSLQHHLKGWKVIGCRSYPVVHEEEKYFFQN